MGVAYGVSDVPDPLWGELLILLVITAGLTFLMGRHSDNVDETSGIISLDDDD